MDEGDLALAFAPEVEESFEDLKPFCKEVARYLLGYQLVKTDANKRKSIRRAVKNFPIWDDGLFRRTPKGPRAIPRRSARPALLCCFMMKLVTGMWPLESISFWIDSGGQMSIEISISTFEAVMIFKL